MGLVMRIAYPVRQITSYPMEGVCMPVPMVLMLSHQQGHVMHVMEVVHFASGLL